MILDTQIFIFYLETLRVPMFVYTLFRVFTIIFLYGIQC